MKNKKTKTDVLKKYKLFGIGMIPTMVIIIVLSLLIIGLYEYKII